jgi:hypothetical protein
MSFHGKLTGAELVKKFLHLWSTIGHEPEPVEPSSRPCILFLLRFVLISSSRLYLSIRSGHQILLCISRFPRGCPVFHIILFDLRGH